MLGKLIKYDFKAMSKSLCPVFAVMAVLSFVCSLMVKFRMTGGFIFTMFAILLGVLISGSFAVTLYCVVRRFNSSLLKDEGYLSFALPVKTQDHIIAKLVNALIWSTLEIVAVAVCVLIMGLIAGSIEDVREVFTFFIKVDRSFWLSMIQVLVLMGLELTASISLVYSSLSIGHMFEKHKRLIAWIFVIVMVILRTMFIPTHFQYDYASGNTLFISPVWYLIPLMYTVIYSLITWFILDKRLNLE